MSLGLRLRTLRKAKKMTQQDLACETNVSRIYIQALESNRRTPSMKMLRRLATALEVDPTDLLGAFVNERPSRLQLEEIFESPEEMDVWYRGHKLDDRDLNLVKRLIEAALVDWEDDLS